MIISELGDAKLVPPVMKINSIFDLISLILFNRQVWTQCCKFNLLFLDGARKYPRVLLWFHR
jgi:hypothetical protein